jgi:hypothetical protein
MTDDTPTSRGIGRLLAGERAMVPLAIIGVFLLLSSLLLVGYMDTREKPDTEVDASLALDRTEATMQTVVRDSSQRAAEMAAAEPLTDPADSPWGEVLDRSSGGFSEDPFVNYLRGLIYTEVKRDLDLASQEEGPVATNVTLPAVNSPSEFADAIRRVDLDGDGPEVTITLSDVTITATYAGEVVEQRNTTVEVTILTPVLQLHEKVSEYQYAIDEAGVTEPGFTQRFNARTYAIGWARGWAQNYRAPVGEVLANRHIEPSANSALYRTQQDVFGAADPNLGNAVRLGWACMALKDGKAMFDEYTGSGTNYSFGQYAGSGTSAYNGSAPDGVDRLCSGAQFLLDQATEQHPEPPEVTELIGGENLLRETETLEVGELAYLPLAEMVDSTSNYSFEKAIQRIFTIEGYVGADASISGGLSFDVDCGRAYRGGPVARDGSYEVTTTSREPVAGDDERYYTYESTIEVTVTAERTCHAREGNDTSEKRDSDSYSIDITTTVGERSDSPTAKIDEVNPSSQVDPAHKYDSGPSAWAEFNNYDGAGEAVTSSILGDTDTDSHEQWLGSMLSQTDYENGPPDEASFETTKAVELDYEELLGEFELTARLTDEIVELQEVAANVSVTYERREMVTGNPTSRLLDELETQLKSAYIDESVHHQYESVGEKVIYEARYVYYLALVEHLNGLEAAYTAATDELDDRITGADSSLDSATRFLTQGLRQRETNPATFATSELTDNISYEVSGAPTYLLSEQTVDTDRVPAVDQGVEFAPLAAKNENVIDMPYEAILDDILAKAMELMPGLSPTPDAEITFRMAGDVLTAGELAVDAHEQAARADRQDTYLSDADQFEQDVEEFETNVEEAVDAFEQEVESRLVTELYPSPATECILSDGSAANEDYPGWQTCREVLLEYGDLEPVVTEARWAVDDALNNSLAPYDTAKTARLIGNGNATEYIVDNVTRELADPKYRDYEAFEERYDDDHWDTLINAAVRPAVMSASERTVEIGSVEQAEALDERIQEALGEATTDLVEARLARTGEAIGETVGERWLGNTRGTVNRAARVPAGLPLLPIPGKWVATVNAWTIEVAGEYARFEVSATVGTPADGAQLTYVRESRTVSYEIAGDERTLGSVESIAFDSRSVLVVVTPPGVGVGDRDDENPECSPTFPHVGELDPNEETTCTSRDDE